MKNKSRQNGVLYCVIGTLMFVFTVFYIAPNSGGAADRIIGEIVSNVSAGQSVVKNMSSSKTNEKNGESADTATAAAEPKNDSVAAPLLENETASGDDSAQSEPGAPYETPDDIAAMSSEYISAFSKTDPAGKVTECFFTNNGATASVGNIHIKNTTSKKPDFAAFLKEGAKTGIEDISAPSVLIFHTHTTESYLMADNGVFYSDYKTRSTDPTRNMVRVGDEICCRLEEKGIGVIHDTNIYDDTYNGAYGRSRKTVLEYLEKYPTIKIVLDVHRDAVYTTDTDHLKPVCKINGKKAAQVMIITGADGGPVAQFDHWEENLKFALALQSRAQKEHEGLMKPVYFCNRRYNMDVTPCSLLLEFGSDANTLDEAVYAASLLGESLAGLICDSASK